MLFCGLLESGTVRCGSHEVPGCGVFGCGVGGFVSLVPLCWSPWAPGHEMRRIPLLKALEVLVVEHKQWEGQDLNASW